MNQIPTIGRIVHFHFVNGNGKPAVRPAIVVEAWSTDDPNSSLNLQVFLDGSNDGHIPEHGDLRWMPSVPAEAHKGASTTWWTWPKMAVRASAVGGPG